ncbi:hypothetical protein ABZX74_27400 [Streptomyces olivaceoviridis]|uniref:hypothetical protein n=1 Tax=Streptomyces olivaceoviridis TaxID=1921 RepID=UPI0033ABFF2A
MLDGEVEQRALPDTGIALDDEGRSRRPRRAQAVQPLDDQPDFLIPADEPVRACPRRSMCGLYR